MNKHNGSLARMRTERGAVLIVALIMLVLVSIIAFSASRSSLLEERMAGNALESNRAFQAAEHALRVGEQAVRAAYPNVGDVAATAIKAGPSGDGYTATWEVEVLAVIETSLEAGAPVQASGVLVRVTGRSSGRSGARDVVLESTYLVEG